MLDRKCPQPGGSGKLQLKLRIFSRICCPNWDVSIAMQNQVCLTANDSNVLINAMPFVKIAIKVFYSSINFLHKNKVSRKEINFTLIDLVLLHLRGGLIFWVWIPWRKAFLVMLEPCSTVFYSKVTRINELITFLKFRMSMRFEGGKNWMWPYCSDLG